MSKATEPKKWYSIRICTIEVQENGEEEIAESIGLDFASTDYASVQDIADALVAEGEERWDSMIDSNTQRVRDPEVYYAFNPREDEEES